MDIDSKHFDFNNKTVDSSKQMMSALYPLGVNFEDVKAKNDLQAKQAVEKANRDEIFSRKELIPLVSGITFRDSPEIALEKLQKIPEANVYIQSNTLNAKGFLLKGVKCDVQIYFNQNNGERRYIKDTDGRNEEWRGEFISSVSFQTVDPQTPTINETNELLEIFKEKCSRFVMDKPENNDGRVLSCRDYMDNELKIELPVTPSYDGGQRWGSFNVWFNKSDKMMAIEKETIEKELNKKRQEENKNKPDASGVM